MTPSSGPQTDFPRHPPGTGYSLIELLTVIVVMGVLAAIAFPRLWGAGDEALHWTLRHDLRNLIQSQEIHLNDNGAYASDLDALGAVSSAGVTLTILEASATGWSASATHEKLDPAVCAVFVGAAAPVPPATDARRIACD